MSIKLRFEKGSLLTQVALKDAALPELMKIVAEYQTDEVPATVLADPSPPLDSSGIVADLPDQRKEPERLEYARGWLVQHSSAEILTQIGWPNFTEKIVLLGALIEAKAGDKFESWRWADIEASFAAARKPAPGNFARDISNAIEATFVQTVTPRTYRLTRTGWLKVYEGIVASIGKRIASPQETWPNQRLVN